MRRRTKPRLSSSVNRWVSTLALIAGWNELQASDQDRSVAFYTRHFGQEGDMDMGNFGSYRFLYLGETMIGAIMPRMPQVPQAAWTFSSMATSTRRRTRRVPAVARSFTARAKSRAASIR